MLLIVTVVARSAPSGPACRTVAAVAETPVLGRVCSALRLAYWLMMPCGRSSDLAQLVTSGWVDSQYTLRSTSAPCWRSSSSTK